MHAVAVLQKLLQYSIPSLHLNRRRALISTVRSAMATRRLTLSGLARGLPTGQAIRHRIKRVDSLLGNRHLHNERPMFYRLLCRQLMAVDPNPELVRIRSRDFRLIDTQHVIDIDFWSTPLAPRLK